MISTAHLMIKITKQLLQEILKIFLFIYNSDFASAKVSLWVLIPAMISRGKPTFCQLGQLAQTRYTNRKHTVEESIIN